MRLRVLVGLGSFGLLSACGGGGGNDFLGAQARTDYHAFAIADVDGDGLDDLVAARVHFDVAGASVGAVDEFLRDPAHPAALQAPVSFAVGCEPQSIAVADLNDDDLPDVAVSCTFAEDGFRVLFQKATGAGELDVAKLVAMPGPVHQLAIADIDMDGLPDVAAALDATLAFATQKTATPGTFNDPVAVGAGSQRIVAVDFDGDGLVDLLAPRDAANASSDAVYYLQDSAVPGTFMAMRVLSASLGVTDVAVGRLDGVAGLDIGVGGVRGNLMSRNGAWMPFLQSAATPGTFGLGTRFDTADSNASLIAIADLDGDGRDDVVVLRRTRGNGPREFDVYLQTAPGAFVRDAQYSIPDNEAVTTPEINALVLADLDHDGLLDVAVSTNEIFYFPQIAAARGTFGAAVRIASQQ